jgi:hypothetical protein
MLKDNTQTIVDKDQQRRIGDVCKDEEEDEEDCCNSSNSGQSSCGCGPKGCQGPVGNSGGNNIPQGNPMGANPVSPRANYPLDWNFSTNYVHAYLLLKEVYEEFMLHPLPEKDGWYSVECTVRHDVDSKTGEIISCPQKF